MVHTKLQLRMKGILPPHLWADSTIYQRFLKARDYDLEKAEVMLKRHLVWRKAHQIDNFLDHFQPKKFFRNYIEPTALGFAKEGEMLIYCPIGRMEIEDALKCSTMNDYMKCWIWYIEKQLRLLKEQSERTGRNCSQMSFIFDLDQLTFGNASNRNSADLFLRLVNLFQDNYPERLKAVYIINAPTYYLLVYNAIKLAMSAAMVKKIQCWQGDFQDRLLEVAEADVLPAFLGGNRTDPDGNPLCQSFVAQGGHIPEDYHLSKEDRYFNRNSDIKSLVIPKCKKEEVVIDVADNGSLLHWEFCVKSKKDISFGLYHQVSNEDVVEILPMEIYQTPDGKEWGSYRCPTAGRYILTFENSQSWISSRVVDYCVNVQNSSLES